MYRPSFRITDETLKLLDSIGADRQAIDNAAADSETLAAMRRSARLDAIHYSTRLDGNRLTRREAADCLAGETIAGRELDVAEVRNYYLALEEGEALLTAGRPISERDVRALAALVTTGEPRLLPYRSDQNVIRISAPAAITPSASEGVGGRILYLPPKASAVPGLMRDLFEWLGAAMARRDPHPAAIAALAHHQMMVIYPYYEGAGRTARLLAGLILRSLGFGVRGAVSLDEYFARDVREYYAALGFAESTYYTGKEIDATNSVAYVCRGLAEALDVARARILSPVAPEVRSSAAGAADPPQQGTGKGGASPVVPGAGAGHPILREIDPRKRRLLDLFRQYGTATSSEIAEYLGLSPRTVTDLCRAWVADGFLEPFDASRKNRSYRLTDTFAQVAAG